MRNLLFVLLGILWSTSLSGQCDTASIYANTTSNAVCFDTTFAKVRNCYSNNYPDHSDSYNSPFTLEASEEEYSMCLYPDTAASFTPLYETTETEVGCTYVYTFGVGTNGVKYDPSSAEYFETIDGENNIEWHKEARYMFNANFGNNGGHLNPFGEYHYHDVPADYFANDLGISIAAHSPIVGYAADGFPMYYKFVYTDANDTTSAITELSSGYSLKSGTRPGDGDYAPDGAYTGLYYEDYEYSATTTLDECNGRWGKTPDFPEGTYYYVLTDNYPYIPRCFKGTVVDNTFRVGPGASCPDSEGETECADAPVIVSGCTDPFSCNYNALATVDDGSCDYNYAYESLTIANCGSYTAPSGQLYSADGIYSDTVLIAGSCDSIYTIDLTVSGATATRNPTDPSSGGASDGQISFGPPSGTPPFRFSIDSAMTYSSSMPPVFSGLSAGTYWTVVKDGNDCEMFEEITLGTTLPVSLMYFDLSCHKNKIQAQWATATEHNNSHFTIQQSKDAQQWEVVKIIPGAGTHLRQKEYQVTWEENGKGAYFRLEQTDLDGRREKYDIVFLDCAKSGEGAPPVSVFPNPARATLNIQQAAGQAIFYNHLGQQVKVLDIASPFFQVDISDLPVGKYFIRLFDEAGKKEVKSFFKWE